LDNLFAFERKVKVEHGIQYIAKYSVA